MQCMDRKKIISITIMFCPYYLKSCLFFLGRKPTFWAAAIPYLVHLPDPPNGALASVMGFPHPMSRKKSAEEVPSNGELFTVDSCRFQEQRFSTISKLYSKGIYDVDSPISSCIPRTIVNVGIVILRGMYLP